MSAPEERYLTTGLVVLAGELTTKTALDHGRSPGGRSARPALPHDLGPRRPICRKTATYGHSGRDDAGFTWEATNRAGARAGPARSGCRRPAGRG